MTIFEAPRPTVEPDNPDDANQVLIKPLFAGFCGSDKSIWFRRAFGDMIYVGMTQDKTSKRIIGHEMVGTILAVGSTVREQYGYKPGDIVTTESHIYCGRCQYCKVGKFHVCVDSAIIGVNRDGAFAEALKLPAKVLWPVDTHKIRLEIAAIMEPFGNAVHSCSVADLKGKTIVIYGLGTIGMFTALIAKAMGAHKIVGIEPDPKHMAMAKEIGVDHVIPFEPAHSTQAPYFDRALVNEVKAYFGDQEPDVVFEMAGYNNSVNHSIATVKRGGHVVLFGLHDGDFILHNFQDVILRGISLHGVIGRKIFETWKIAQAILENTANGVQDKIYNVILNGGKGTVISFQDFDPAAFESALSTHPKLIIQF